MYKLMFRRSVWNWRMAAVVFAVSIIYYYELIANEGLFTTNWSENENIDILYMHLCVYAFSYFVIMAGFFPAIPYGLSVWEERNSGYLRFELQRMSWKRYIDNKILFSGISGACTMLFPYIILIAPLSCLCVQTTPEVHTDIWDTQIWGEFEYIWGGYYVVLLKGVLLVLFGILWAELGLFCSLIIKNRYMAALAPFMIYEFLWLVNIRGSWIDLFNPQKMIRAPYEAGSTTIWAPFGVFVVYIGLLCVLNRIMFGWQVKHGNI